MELGDRYFRGTNIEKPREKAIRNGIATLDDSELLALLLNTGTKNENVVEFSNRILYEKGGLRGLVSLDYDDLTTFGVKKTKAFLLLAMREIIRRLPFEENKRVTDTYSLAKDLIPLFQTEKCESLLVLYLDKRKMIIKREISTSKSVERVKVDVTSILKTSLSLPASFVITAHNHCSSIPRPSLKDLEVFKKLRKILSDSNIILLDNLIVTSKGYWSELEERGISSLN